MVRRSDSPHAGACQVNPDMRVAHGRDFGAVPSPLLIFSASLSPTVLRRSFSALLCTLLHERTMNVGHRQVGMPSDMSGRHRQLLWKLDAFGAKAMKRRR